MSLVGHEREELRVSAAVPFAALFAAMLLGTQRFPSLEFVADLRQLLVWCCPGFSRGVCAAWWLRVVEACSNVYSADEDAGREQIKIRLYIMKLKLRMNHACDWRYVQSSGLYARQPVMVLVLHGLSVFRCLPQPLYATGAPHWLRLGDQVT